MIISDKYRFCFIHIPKCAGTSVRLILQRYDDTGGRYNMRIADHPILGQLDYVHIPLSVIKEYFPEEFAKIGAYQSFAILRDPYRRFQSSMSQWLKAYRDKPIQHLTPHQIGKEIDICIRHLTAAPRSSVLSPELIHFQKQNSYIDIDGARIIKRLYTVGQIDRLFVDVSSLVGDSQLGQSGNEGKLPYDNQTLFFRSRLLKRLYSYAQKPPVAIPLNKVLPEKLKSLVREVVYVQEKSGVQEVFDSSYVRSFVEQYYADDFEILGSLI